MKLAILVLSIHADGEKIDGADYAIVLLPQANRDMLKRRCAAVKTLKEQDRDAMAINWFGEPDIIISADQFEDIFAENAAVQEASAKGHGNLSIITDIEKEALDAIESQTEIPDGLRLGACDLRTYDDNFRWYLYEKHSGVEMFTNETMVADIP